jgi:hypothetical protein
MLFLLIYRSIGLQFFFQAILIIHDKGLKYSFPMSCLPRPLFSLTVMLQVSILYRNSMGTKKITPIEEGLIQK